MGNKHSYHWASRFINAKSALLTFGLIVHAAGASTNTLSLSGNVAVRETFDNNVYLQSRGPSADRESLITSVLPQAGLTWTPHASFDATLGYSAGLHWFHNEPGEDHTVHRGVLNWSTRFGDTSVESVNSIAGIDGSDVGPTWVAPGAVPAAGGPAVRDRYDAIVYRNQLRVVHGIGDWFIRPAATWYAHDWGTDERNTRGYQNYADRTEWTAGPDLGLKLKPDLAVFAGYRFGQQSQEQVLRLPEQYDNDFHRALLGLEGKVAPWLKACVVAGPEFRRYADTVPATFDRSRINVFVDAAVTVTPTVCDTVTLAARQFQQPGFSGCSAYTDLTYDFEWRHKLGKQVTVGLGARAYNTYFLRPIKRNDWVLTPNVVVNYAATPHWNFEASAGHERGFTRNEGFEGRDYDRTFVNLGVKYTWR